MTAPQRTPTRQEAIDGFGQSIGVGLALSDSLTVEEAAKISTDYLLGHRTLDEMCERIRARRAEARAAAAQSVREEE